jgi:hypothetical protein
MTACRTLTLEARDLVDLLRVVGFSPEDINHTLIALSLPVPLSHQELPLVQFSSVVLTVGLVFTPCLQKHPGAKKKIIQSIEKRSNENKGSLQHLLVMQGVDIGRQKRVKQDMNVCQRKDY